MPERIQQSDRVRNDSLPGDQKYQTSANVTRSRSNVVAERVCCFALKRIRVPSFAEFRNVSNRNVNLNLIAFRKSTFVYRRSTRNILPRAKCRLIFPILRQTTPPVLKPSFSRELSITRKLKSHEKSLSNRTSSRSKGFSSENWTNKSRHQVTVYADYYRAGDVGSRRTEEEKRKKGRESETAAAEWKSHTKLRVTYHFPLIRISGTTEPGDVQACTVKYSEEVWPGVNQRGKPTLSCQPLPHCLRRCIAPTWMLRHSIHTRTYILRCSAHPRFFHARRPMRFNYRSLLFTPCRGKKGRNTANETRATSSKSDGRVQWGPRAIV